MPCLVPKYGANYDVGHLAFGTVLGVPTEGVQEVEEKTIWRGHDTTGLLAKIENNWKRPNDSIILATKF